MSHPLVRMTALAAATAALLALPTGSASATPACSDPVANALHVVHDRTGDPAGVVHEVEETYCSVG